MNVMVSEKLKELRKQRGNTLEELAGHAGVTAQAASKWERGESLPDITLLPSIALYYDVSIDDLLGFGEERKRERIGTYYKKWNETLTPPYGKDTLERQEKVWREALSEFPNDTNVMIRLMNAIFHTGQWEPEKADELIALGETVLKKSVKDEERFEAIELVGMTYSTIKKDKAKAKEYALKLPEYGTTVHELMPGALDEDEAFAYRQGNLERLVTQIFYNVQNAYWNRPVKDRIRAHKFALGVFTLLYEDGDFGANVVWVREICLSLAEWHLSEGQADEAVGCLEKAAEAGLTNKRLADAGHRGPGGSFMLSKYVSEEVDKIYSKEHAKHYFEMLGDRLGEKRFDALRGAPRFTELQERIKRYIS